MEEKVINGLQDIGYTGPLLSKHELGSAVQEGPKSIEYTRLVNYLAGELRVLLRIDEEVNTISDPEDSVSFVLELSSFLKELNCSYSAFTQGHVSDRFESVSDRLLLLDYLISELMGARILQEKKPEKKIELKLHETEEAACMRKMLMTLRFPKPPANITVPQLFQKLNPTVQSTVQKAGSDLVGNPAFNGTLSDQQWETLNTVQKDLNDEYKIRREMLLTRLDVTIQSFQWSDKTKGKDELFEKIYSEKRKHLKAEPAVDISNLLAARDEIAIIEKTSNSSVRKNTKSSVNRVIIGQVPDRGGRTSEIAPPPPEMPSWQQRVPGSSGGGRGGGRGSFSGNKQQNYSRGNESTNNYGGNYSNRQGGYDSAGSYGGYSNSGGGNSSGGYNQGRNYDNTGSYNKGNVYDSRPQSTGGRGSYDNRGSYDSRDSGGSRDNTHFDSAGSYQYEQNSKRAKTYDSYQSNRTTYSDQYVQEEQQNRQFHRGGGGNRAHNQQRGRSNYSRGGGRSNNY